MIRIDWGVVLLVAIVCLLMPPQWVAFGIYALSVPAVAVSVGVIVGAHWTVRFTHLTSEPVPEELVARLRVVFVYYLLLVLAGLLLVWQRYPLWGSA